MSNLVLGAGAILSVLGVAVSSLFLPASEGTAHAQNIGEGCESTIDCVEITKVTDPSGSGRSFDFEITGGGDSVDFHLEDGDSAGFVLSSGINFTVVEDVPSGWRVAISCEGEGDVSFEIDDDEGRVVIITIGNKFSAACTFTNTRDPDEDEADEGDQGTRFLGGGIFQGDLGAAERNRERARAAAAAAVAATPRPAETIRPPSTGDAGLQP